MLVLIGIQAQTAGLHLGPLGSTLDNFYIIYIYIYIILIII